MSVMEDLDSVFDILFLKSTSIKKKNKNLLYLGCKAPISGYNRDIGPKGAKGSPNIWNIVVNVFDIIIDSLQVYIGFLNYDRENLVYVKA